MKGYKEDGQAVRQLKEELKRIWIMKIPKTKTSPHGPKKSLKNHPIPHEILQKPISLSPLPGGKNCSIIKVKSSKELKIITQVACYHGSRQLMNIIFYHVCASNIFADLHDTIYALLPANYILHPIDQFKIKPFCIL